MRFGRGQEEGRLGKGSACQPRRNEELGGEAPHDSKRTTPPLPKSDHLPPFTPSRPGSVSPFLPIFDHSVTQKSFA